MRYAFICLAVFVFTTASAPAQLDCGGDRATGPTYTATPIAPLGDPFAPGGERGDVIYST